LNKILLREIKQGINKEAKKKKEYNERKLNEITEIQEQEI